MALTSYRAVRPWARAIRGKVVSLEMPPWYADPARSLAFKNDRRLSQEQIQTIATWADAGAPMGNPIDLPPIPVGWQIGDLGEPDAITRMPVPEQIPASGELPMTNYYIPVPWDELKYARALESKPGNRVATHHTLAYIRSGLPPATRLNDKGLAVRDPSIEVEPNASFEFAQRSVKLTGYAPGKGYKRYPTGAGRVLPPEWYFVLNQHYQPTGKPETDQSELGLWFHDEPVAT
ncbi:MAG: thiol-disulfide isomerase, partial [Acidobacteriota bacterium]|nr:thiol-disulfide isomerase [Acidobacteriota bacterium]